MDAIHQMHSGFKYNLIVILMLPALLAAQSGKLDAFEKELTE